MLSFIVKKRYVFYRYVVLKLVLFEFVNTFLSLFYIAFYLQDIAMLKSQVFTMLIVIQIVNQVRLFWPEVQAPS